MWRRRDGGKPELIEGRLASWLHEVMVMWLGLGDEGCDEADRIDQQSSWT